MPQTLTKKKISLHSSSHVLRLGHTLFLSHSAKEFNSALGVQLIYQLVSDGTFLQKSYTDYNSLDNNNKKLVDHNTVISQVELIVIV